MNGLPLNGTRLRRLRDLVALLDSGKVQCRRYEQGFLHAKQVIVERGEHVRAVIGSSNLTAAGLSHNQEFNAILGRAEARAALQIASRWWAAAAPYDLGALVRQLFTCQPAELVFLRMLAEAYEHEVNASPSPCMDLSDYQRDGVARVRALLARHGGALIADEVGLGKTYIAGEVARLSLLEGCGSVLVVSPASLCRMWRRRLAEWGLGGVQVISYDRLVSLYRKVTEHGHQWQRYGLLIADEAHTLRNPLTMRMEAVRSLLSAQNQPSPAPGGAGGTSWNGTKVVVMSATPVNNDGGDLFELLALTDRSLEPHWKPGPTFCKTRDGARSPDGRRLARLLANPAMANGQDKAWYYQFAYDRMLRRDRPFLHRAYAIPDEAMPFPNVEHRRIDVPLTPAVQVLFAAVLDAVGQAERLPSNLREALAQVRGPARRPRTLTLAVYRRSDYRWEAGERHDGLLRGLLRALLVKRLESSPAALLSTIEHMQTAVRQTLNDLDQGIVRLPGTADSGRWRKLAGLWDDGEDLEADRLLDDPIGARSCNESAELYDAARLRADLTRDLQILRQLAVWGGAAVLEDPKKQAFQSLLLTALTDPRGPKIVVFASSRATTHELGSWLEDLITHDERFAALRGRIANLGCRPEPRSKATEGMLAGFAPEVACTTVTEATLPRALNLYDVLICTDKFSEGVNLQQAALCVNYDLTWNPQRLGQRTGRLDRVGSPHEHITCWTLLPDKIIDAVLHVMDTLVRKAQIAADTVGVPTPLFPDSPWQSYTSLLQTWDIPAHTDEAPVDLFTRPIRDHEWATAWLGNALRSPAAATAIRELPHGSGGVRRLPGIDPGVVFCFAVHAPGGHRTTAFAHIYTGERRAGHISLDTHRCLHHARLDPTSWLHATRPSSSRRLHKHEADLVASLLDSARATVAQQHGIPECVATERIQLICWMLLTDQRPGERK
ncbi:hypothetical protein GCM10010439_55480 [Actinocorallia aurantiaca]|uniref:Helicase n=1 Tax=Actinocorallia aurantiaca TaxID=46204 RepID=A0ABN3UNJ5_9ACTN